jgi:hypothetical protein
VAQAIASAQEVVTQFEKNDKDLKCASATAQVDSQTGEVTLEILCPPSGRWIDEGMTFFTSQEPNHVTSVEAVTPVELPENALYAGSPVIPAGTAIKAYHDEEVAEANQGWRVPASPDYDDIGFLKLVAISGYGWFPGNLILRVKGKQKGTPPFSSWFTVNVKWGKDHD